ncbi:HD-GYP domain-containing protein [Longimicrobium sp.]|uniref:HD-GYP domain-containing protein n=1 Tax=Longimicrobium sp. TaxID=2029185 RepID=UPI002E3543D2|nr:HD domain-containing phosphohydrolase [Longimicrobium sp.]HEX6038577.1 HD domain-containing phosphohydrolase [Longimicrobium sp.]
MALESPRILAADDDAGALRVLERILARAGFTDVRTTLNGLEVPDLFREFAPDLVVLDLHMGLVEGTDVIRSLRPLIPAGTYLPILVVSGDLTREARVSALAEGAVDFISKPYAVDEVLLRVQNHLHTRSLHLSVARQNRELEGKVQARTRELEEAAWEVLERLARAAELRDDDTGLHTRRVAELSARIAAAMGLPAAEVEMLRRTAPLHDVGKIGIPDGVLLKPGKLNEGEWELMKRHTVIGAQILSAGRSEMVRMAEQIALSHHERWDGRGYPLGTAGEAIPLSARIVALADVYDALSSDRPYRPAWPHDRVMDEIRAGRGTHFDPGVVDVFLTAVAPDLERTNGV